MGPPHSGQMGELFLDGLARGHVSQTPVRAFCVVTLHIREQGIVEAIQIIKQSVFLIIHEPLLHGSVETLANRTTRISVAVFYALALQACVKLSLISLPLSVSTFSIRPGNISHAGETTAVTRRRENIAATVLHETHHRVKRHTMTRIRRAEAFPKTLVPSISA